MFLFEFILLLSVFCSGRDEAGAGVVGVGCCCGEDSVIGKSQSLSFCHVVSFFISGLIFHWRASSIHLNLLFLALRKLMNSNICERLCVCLCAH